MNKQRLFNKVKKHLLAQKKLSVKKIIIKEELGIICAYRGENRLRCAIGCLIPNRLYKKEMEKKLVNGLLIKFPELKDHFGIEKKIDITFLTELQKIHDGHEPKEWRRFLREFASDWELEA